MLMSTAVRQRRILLLEKAGLVPPLKFRLGNVGCVAQFMKKGRGMVKFSCKFYWVEEIGWDMSNGGAMSNGGM